MQVASLNLVSLLPAFPDWSHSAQARFTIGVKLSRFMSWLLQTLAVPQV